MSSKKATVIELTEETIENFQQIGLKKEIEIKSAKLHDGRCHYSYEINDEVTSGDVVTRKGSNYYHEDLKNAFSELDVFIAHIDGAFKTWSNNQTPIEKLEQSAELGLYQVNAFKIQGNDENVSVILVGSKETDYGLINFETPKIKLEKTTYLYIDDLNFRLNVLIGEVDAYKNGKKEPEDDPNQVVMEFESDDDLDLDNAKV